MIGTRNGWQRFWDKGGWWRPFVLAIAYLIVYNGISFVTSTVFAGFIDSANPTSTGLSVFFGLALPILLAGLVLLGFIRSLRWTGEVFARRSRGPGWMWIAVVIVIIPIVLRGVATNWSAYTVDTIAALLLLGLCVGFAEELISRGAAVAILRRGGSSERVVMLLSSAVFGLLHVGNVFAGQSPLTVAVIVVYAFGFGAMMYLALRVTGSIVAAMLLHAATDPITILATGGIDAHGATAGSDGLIAIAGLFNILYIVFAVVAIFLVRGKVSPAAEARTA